MYLTIDCTTFEVRQHQSLENEEISGFVAAGCVVLEVGANQANVGITLRQFNEDATASEVEVG